MMLHDKKQQPSIYYIISDFSFNNGVYIAILKENTSQSDHVILKKPKCFHNQAWHAVCINRFIKTKGANRENQYVCSLRCATH